MEYLFIAITPRSTLKWLNLFVPSVGQIELFAILETIQLCANKWLLNWIISIT